MKYVPIPIALLEVGKPLPVDVLSSTGQLLLRRGHPIATQQDRERLYAFAACTTELEGLAWQRAYERKVHDMLRSGAPLEEIARASMPEALRDSDFVVSQQPQGSWLDLQEVLRGILYQGGLAVSPLARLAGLQDRAMVLLEQDADHSLFCLFQALADDSLGYCATHALLCAVVAELSARILGFDAPQRRVLFAAALTMNIGMARAQDSLARQQGALSAEQRTLVARHGALGAELLQSLGQDDTDVLDLVRWHHTPDAPQALAHTARARRLLHLADAFVARVAARKTRAAQSALRAVKSMVIDAPGEDLGMGSAMAQAVGFYPPGSYVELLNGEAAVAVQRGARANTPWVISLADKDGVPIARYVCRDTAQTAYTLRGALSADRVKVVVHADKVAQARARLAA